MNFLESVTRRIASVARVVALLAAIDTARAQSASGSIHGIVNDSTGAPQSVPPRFAPGARPDTAPAEMETLDRVAKLARLPRLRAQPPSGGRRELRFWIGGGIAIPYVLIRLTADGDRVQGQVFHYLEQTIPDREVNPRWRAFMDSVASWLRRDFGCRSVATDTLHHPEVQAGYRDELVAVCRSRYPREPEWGGLLRELETHHVWTLPDESELPTIGGIVSVDGGGATVEAWNGDRYHSYTVADTSLAPASAAHDGAAIRRILIAFLTRLHYELHPPPP